MRVHIIGPNLPDQSLGSFHVHMEGCADVKRNPHYKSREFASDRENTIDVASVEDIVRYTYADQIDEGMEVSDGFDDFHLFPCVGPLPERNEEKKQGLAIANLFVYATGDRADGLKYAVGVMYENNTVNGSYALFSEYETMVRFVETESTRFKGKTHFLPSAIPNN